MDNLPDDPLPILRKALLDRSPSVVYTAARRIQQREIRELQQEAAQALERFLTEKDPGCRAKRALLETLDNDPLLFLKAIVHVQNEPSFGGPEDTAAELRGLAAVKLAQCGWPDAAEQILPLLVDPQLPARVSAVRALAFLGESLVLRLLALHQDEDLIQECLDGVLHVEGKRALPFVEEFLRTHFQAAALALGGCRLPLAVDALRDAWDHVVDREQKKTLLVALATARAVKVLEELSGEEWVRGFLDEQKLLVLRLAGHDRQLDST